MPGYIRRSVNDMDGYVPGEQPKDRNIIKLNTNENPYPPSKKIRDILSRVNADDLRLYPDPLCSELRSIIAAFHKCSIDEVFVGNGSDEVLALCTRAFVEDDGTVGFMDPSYSLYPVLASIRNVKTKPLSLNKDFTFELPANYDCSLFFLANPNAPTGILAPKNIVRTFSSALNGVVVIDEAYVDFSNDNCMDLALSMDNVLVARTLSKSFSLAGLRLGYVVGSRTLINAMYKIKDSYNIDMLCQRIAAAALSDIEHMRANSKRIIATRERLKASLESHGFEVFPSQSNFLWTRPDGISAKDLFERLKDEGILIRYFKGDRTGMYVRITIGTDDDIDRLIDAVKRII